MRIRCLVKFIVQIILAYYALGFARSTIQTRCAEPALRSTTPCVLFSSIDSSVRANVRFGVDRVSTKLDEVTQLQTKWHKSGYGPRLAHLHSVSQAWIESEVVPRTHAAARHASKYARIAAIAGKDTALRTFDVSCHYTRTHVWPQTLRGWKLLRIHARLVWDHARRYIESSHLWREVVVPQSLKIDEFVRRNIAGMTQTIPQAATTAASTAASVVSEASASAESAASVASLAASEAVASASASAASSVAAASASASSALAAASAALVLAAASESAASASSAASESALASSSSAASALAASESASSESVTSSSASVASGSSASSSNVSDSTAESTPAASISERIRKTVEGALHNLEDDAQTHIEQTLKLARPEIVSLLRNISKYGESAVRNMTVVTEKVETDYSVTDADAEVYEPFILYSRELAEKALRVRERVELLANDALKGLDSVRQVTLDALDDYFDVVLSEAGRELSSRADWADWKSFHNLKDELKELRESVELHGFNMTEVNTALRESQSAAVLLVQEYNKQLTELRQRCQLVFQRLNEDAEEEYEPEKYEEPAEPLKKQRAAESPKSTEDQPAEHVEEPTEPKEEPAEQVGKPVKSKEEQPAESAGKHSTSEVEQSAQPDSAREERFHILPVGSATPVESVEPEHRDHKSEHVVVEEVHVERFEQVHEQEPEGESIEYPLRGSIEYPLGDTIEFEDTEFVETRRGN